MKYDADGFIDSPLYCEHTNEVPCVCPCPGYCYCKPRSCANGRGLVAPVNTFLTPGGAEPSHWREGAGVTPRPVGEEGSPDIPTCPACHAERETHHCRRCGITEPPDRKAALVYIAGGAAVLSVWNRRYHVWGMPGGKVELGEDVRAAALREVTEETGMVVSIGEQLDVSPTYSGSGRMCHTFRGTVLSSLVDLRLMEVGTGVAWMTREFLMDQGNLDHPGYGGEISEWFKTFFGKVPR